MATDQNEIQLNDEDRRLLRRAEVKLGKPWRVILREKLGQAPNANRDETPPRDNSRGRQNWTEFLDEMASLPTEGVPDDGICASRDHDLILYGKK